MKMTYILAAVAAATIASPAVHGQSHNPALKDSKVRTTATAAKGHNSFTESQARGRIAKAGYSNITQLAKNKNGVWQGRAKRHGKWVTVALDYKGNVTIH